MGEVIVFWMWNCGVTVKAMGLQDAFFVQDEDGGDAEGLDSEAAALMGFSGFGGSKKWSNIVSLPLISSSASMCMCTIAFPTTVNNIMYDNKVKGEVIEVEYKAWGYLQHVCI